jgi:precorrin-4 methylase
MTPLVLTAEQIKALADFAEQDGPTRLHDLRPASPNLKLMTAALCLVTRALSPTQNQKSTVYFSWKIKHYRSHSTSGFDNAPHIAQR